MAKPLPDFAALQSAFVLEGTYVDSRPHGSGHINDTFVLRHQRQDGSLRRTLFQRINGTVFPDIPVLMANVAQVTQHLRAKIEAAGGDPWRETLNLVPTREGGDWHRDAMGEAWRAYRFIEGARTFDRPQDRRHLREAGRAIGRFQRQMADFPARRLHETLPHFHDTGLRLNAFHASLAEDRAGRAARVAREIACVQARAAECSRVVDRLASGELPLRVVHNDTKFNNVMIDDATGKALCLVDLDTVMPGSALYDFGDAIRSCANTAEEDAQDVEQVACDLDVFEACAEGYLDAALDFLAPAELELLAFSPRLLALECGMRFLTDYLNGDVYFKIHHPDHNLHRARVQFRLLEDMERKRAAMEAVVERFAQRSVS